MSEAAPSSARKSAGRYVVVGANFRTASLALRDQMFVDDDSQPAFLARLAREGLAEAVAISTCDRVEVVAVEDDKDKAERIVTQAMAERAGVAPSGLAGQLYALSGAEAVRHVFAVASALESLVIGEPHVLGQVKTAHKISHDLGHCGGDLEALLQAAYGTAKRVKSETRVAEGPVSIAAAAVQFAKDLHGDLKRVASLVVGAGDMGELVAESLKSAGIKRQVVTAPRISRAETLAKTLDCHVAPFDSLAEAIAEADIVLACVGGRTTTIKTEMVQAALKKRKRRPIFFVDAGIPGDIDPAVNKVDGAFLYDLNDLERVALEGRAQREAASHAAWDIVGAEVAEFLKGRAERAAVPALTALRNKAEAMRAQALAEAGGDAEKATRLLLHRLLHDPSEAMKELAAGSEDWARAEALLKRLFRLDAGAKE